MADDMAPDDAPMQWADELARLGSAHDGAFAMAELRFPHIVASEVWCAQHLHELAKSRRLRDYFAARLARDLSSCAGR